MSGHYDKFPVVPVRGVGACAWRGWEAIGERLRQALRERAQRKTVLVVECYTGMLDDEVLPALQRVLSPKAVVRAAEAFRQADKIDALVQPDVTDDPVFGRLTRLQLEDFLGAGRVAELRRRIAAVNDGVVLVYGTGATLLADGDILVYADLTRREAQLRFRRDQISNLGVDNRS